MTRMSFKIEIFEGSLPGVPPYRDRWLKRNAEPLGGIHFNPPAYIAWLKFEKKIRG
ncbi:MAG: hypothetical protein IPO00_10055 [Betaproteobacteria bacterium]|nr:hypothetical protein [Betaproteobacteria bacterium]